MTQFGITYKDSKRWLQVEDKEGQTELWIHSKEQLESLEPEQLKSYAQMATNIRNRIHKLTATMDLTPEQEYVVRTTDWLAGETRRQLVKQ